MTTQDPTGGLTDTEVHGILKNERRNHVLNILLEHRGWVPIRELAELIARFETGESPAPRSKRQSVYVSLVQTHFPTLEELDVIVVDDDGNRVSLDERASDLESYFETARTPVGSWGEFYIGVVIVALLTLAAAVSGVPGFRVIDPSVWAILFFAIILVGATYHTIQQGSSLINRLT